MEDGLLSLLLLIPLFGALPVMLVRDKSTARWVALGASLCALLLSLAVALQFDAHRISPYAPQGNSPGVAQLVTDLPWIPALNIHYRVGVDGLNLPLVLLTTVISTIAVIASWNTDKMQQGYLALLLLLESCILGVFLSLDLFQFYVFFEVSLLPMYFLIGIWGGPRREFAAIKFFLYTLVGSVALLVGVIGIYLYSRQIIPGGTFDLMRLADPAFQGKLNTVIGGLTGPAALTLFLLLMTGFLIKLPSVPFHTWLPDAHVEAPTPISMILAALLLKLGGYGILRVAYPLFPQAAKALWVLIAIFGVLSLIYAGFCTLAQSDFKRLVAYSSISHMGLVTLGAAMMTPAGFNGAIFMMVAHGITSAMLFFMVGVLYDRLGHRDLNRMGGVAGKMPVFTGLGMVGLFANLALPGLCGFVGEVLVLIGSFQAARPESALHRYAAEHGQLGWLTAAVVTLSCIACINLVITASYTLWALQRIFFGSQKSDDAPLPDLDRRELNVLIPLAVLCVALGIFPAVLIFSLSGNTVTAIFRLF